VLPVGSPQLATFSQIDIIPKNRIFEKKMQSPITNSTNVEVLVEIPTDLIIARYAKFKKMNVSRFFTNLAAIQICQCRDSGFRFYYPASVAGDDQFYQDLQQSEVYYRRDRTEHRRAQAYIKPNAKVLEIGTGTGFFLDLLRPVTTNCVGLELNTKAVAVAQQNGFDVRNELVEAHSAAHPNTYDVVCSFQVLEHVPDVRSYIAASLVALKSGGLMLIGVPNNNPYMHRYDLYDVMNLPPHHSGLWDRAAFEALPQFFEMELVAIDIEPLIAFAGYLGAWVKHRFGYAVGDVVTNILLSKPVSPFVKLAMQPFTRRTEGRNILAVYRKK
jgi:SAM-dependent methyltransferase